MNKELTIRPGALSSAVEYVARWLNARPTNPIHACLMLRADGGQLTVSAFSDTATARATADYDGDADGDVVVSGRLLAALVKTFPEKPITVQEEDGELVIESGRYRVGLPTMPAEDFPQLPDTAPIAGWVNGDDLATAVRRVAFAADTNAARIPLLGIHIAYRDDVLILTTTDTIRAARTSVKWHSNSTPEQPTLVLAQTLRDAMDGFQDSDEVAIGLLGDSVFSLDTPTRTLVVSSTLRGEFPAEPLDRIMSNPTAADFTVQPKDLIAPVKRASLLNNKDQMAVRVDLTSNILTLGVGTNAGHSGEEIDVQYDGPDCTLYLNSNYLIEAMQSAPAGSVRVAFNPNTINPVVLTSPDNNTWHHMLKPIRPPGGTK